jgi:hypothetical protein
MNEDIRKIVLTSGPTLDIHQNESSEWVWEVKLGSTTIGRSHKGFSERMECVKNLIELNEKVLSMRADELLK